MSYTWDMSLSTDDTKDILLNPVLTIMIADHFFGEHDTTFAKEDWTKASDIQMKEKGARAWLEALLDSLTGPYDALQAGPISPYHAISFHPSLQSLEPYIERDIWLDANVKLIDELGSTEWLWRLLDVLESGKVPSKD